jgi:transcriptional regulator with XRE-family HTH domain
MDMIVSIVKASTFYKPNGKYLRSLAVEIKRLRKAKGLTVEGLSDLCGLHSKYLQTIERGQRNISISVFIQIANALGLTPPKLLSRILEKA